MRFARFKDSISDQQIEVATNSRWRQSKALPQDYSGRGSVFEDRARDSVTGADVIDFHNSIVS
jgi:hypothetical protein